MRSSKRVSLWQKQAACFLLVILADVLFYKQAIGWTAGLYIALLMLIMTAFNRRLLSSSTNKMIALLTVLLMLNLVESPSLLTAVMIAFGLVSLIVQVKRGNIRSATLLLQDLGRFIGQGGWQWYGDLQANKRVRCRQVRPKVNLRYLIVPVGLTLLFGSLFIQANPIINKSLTGLEFEFLNPVVSFFRWIYWFWVGLMAWALLRPRFALAMESAGGLMFNVDRWLNPQTMQWSLCLFNALFLLQNSLDIVFLWSGQELPMGLTYAEYAHAGFYPLLAINFLTAVFVLLTYSEHQQSFQTDTAKKLVLVWLCQNIFLTLSAINRLLHYIEAYSLTYQRIAALMAMVLTAIGLLLIIVRILEKHRNVWLINANAIALVVTLYGACFFNTDRIIADYNVRHSLEVTGIGSNVDLPYLQSLGPESLPALRWFQANAKYSPVQARKAGELVKDFEEELAKDISDWRAWTWRKYRQFHSYQLPLTAEQIGNTGWQY